MSKVMLCVPNFSEGRRPEVVEAIVRAIREATNVNVFSVESDYDHNRSVVSMLGTPEALETAILAGIRQASELIDMDAHDGEHPRMGATDVVPFIPVRDVTMDDCVESARRLGKRVGDELGIPVYLYEQAATRPERTNLAKVRKGQYEGIKSEIAKNPDRGPDFGPSVIGKAGATAIGARRHLVAYNVYLDTDDVEIAKKIAVAIRQSSGGLPYVKAIGLLVGGLAQVSMNLTNVEETPIHTVVEAIRAKAAEAGIGVSHSELIGVAPQKAFYDTAASCLQLDLDPNQVLETHLTADQPTTLNVLLHAIADSTPSPGGGSVAALAGALSAALVMMVVGVSAKKQPDDQTRAMMGDVIAEAEQVLAAQSARIIEDDAAYKDVVRTYRLPRSTNEEKEARHLAIRESTETAAEVPLATARGAATVITLLASIVNHTTKSCASDLKTAVSMARAAFEGAVTTIQANIDQLEPSVKTSGWTEEIARLQAELETSCKRILTNIEEGGN